MSTPTGLTPETFECGDCGEQYRGYKFFSLHMRDEHGKDAPPQESASKARTAFTIIAGKPRTDREEAKSVGFLPEDYQVGDVASAAAAAAALRIYSSLALRSASAAIIVRSVSIALLLF